jgi:hypothetical protein
VGIGVVAVDDQITLRWQRGRHCHQFDRIVARALKRARAQRRELAARGQAVGPHTIAAIQADPDEAPGA